MTFYTCYQSIIWSFCCYRGGSLTELRRVGKAFALLHSLWLHFTLSLGIFCHEESSCFISRLLPPSLSPCSLLQLALPFPPISAHDFCAIKNPCRIAKRCRNFVKSSRNTTSQAPLSQCPVTQQHRRSRTPRSTRPCTARASTRAVQVSVWL